MISLWIFFGLNLLNNIHYVQGTSVPIPTTAVTSVDIMATPGSSTPFGDPIVVNMLDPKTNVTWQYPATQVASGLNSRWQAVPTGLNASTTYKCWVSRDTNNPQSVAMSPDNQIAYRRCTAEPFQQPQTLVVDSWGDLQGNGLPSTSTNNVYMLYSAYPVANCDGVTFPVWFRLPTNYTNQKRCSTIIMYEANCYFDKSRCTTGYEYNVDDQLNRMESSSSDGCLIALLFGSLEGQNIDSCSLDNYLQATREVVNNQVSSLSVNADPSQNILFGIGYGATVVFQALPLMFYWAWQYVVINPIYSDTTGQQALYRIQSFVQQSNPYAKNTNCIITAPVTDPATNQYTRPMADMLTNLSPYVYVRFMQPKMNYYSMRTIMITFDMNTSFQKLSDNAKKNQMCSAQTNGINQRKKRNIIKRESSI